MSLTVVNSVPDTDAGKPSAGVIGAGAGIFVSTGHVGVDASGVPVTRSPEDQIVALFENLDATLKEAGLGFEQVMRMTSFVKSFDAEFMATFRTVRARYLSEEAPPASVMVQAALYDDCLLVESEVIALVP